MNRKGFTLIELLAIIVILAIIAVITVPLILNIVEDATRNSAISSAYGYKDAIDKYYATKMLQDSSFTISEGTYYINGDTGYLERNSETLAIATSGRVPSLGSVKIGSGAEVEEMQLCINNYMVSFRDGEDISVVKGCTPVEPGLYDINNNLVVSYDYLVSEYGFDPSIDSDSGDETRDILANYSNGVKFVFPDTVTKIGAYAFFRNSSLTSITIPSSVTSIGDSSFSMCEDLKTVKFESGSQLTIIDEYAFEETALTSVTIPASVTTLGEGAFDTCESLKSVTFESGSQLTSIGSYVFDFTGLPSITIPASVTTIEEDAFMDVRVVFYTGSAEDTAGDNWGAVSLNPYMDGDFAYSDNTKTELLAYIGPSTPVTVPSSVTSIGRLAFDFSNVSILTVPSSVTNIGDYAFDSVKVVYYTGSATDSNNHKWNAVSLNPYVEGDFAYSDSTKTVLEVYIGTSPSVTVPSGVTRIKGTAFYYNRDITSLTIPASVTTIDSLACYHCENLASLTFESGSHLTSIGSTSFYENKSLTSIIIPASVTSIDGLAFSQCHNLSSVTFESGSQLTSIGEAAFPLASLTSITIPSSVTSIGKNAFLRVGTVYYSGSAVDVFGNNWGATQVIRN